MKANGVETRGMETASLSGHQAPNILAISEMTESTDKEA